MGTLLKSILLYVALIALFRFAGKRTLRQITVFDLVLLLIIAEATQETLTGGDPSMTQALVIITTLVLMDIALARAKKRWRSVDHWMDGLPVVVMRDGVLMEELMDRSDIDKMDILQAARERQGLGQMEQIRFAILERDGEISIVPWSK